jgi:hypothetical protein
MREEGQMDTRTKQSFGWLKDQMPKVAQLIADHRAKHGPEWLAECWKRGVVQGEPGWFFACEGVLAVGAVWDDARVLALQSQGYSPGRALLVLRPAEQREINQAG